MQEDVLFLSIFFSFSTSPEAVDILDTTCERLARPSINVLVTLRLILPTGRERMLTHIKATWRTRFQVYGKASARASSAVRTRTHTIVHKGA